MQLQLTLITDTLEALATAIGSAKTQLDVAAVPQYRATLLLNAPDDLSPTALMEGVKDVPGVLVRIDPAPEENTSLEALLDQLAARTADARHVGPLFDYAEDERLCFHVDHRVQLRGVRWRCGYMFWPQKAREWAFAADAETLAAAATQLLAMLDDAMQFLAATHQEGASNATAP